MGAEEDIIRLRLAADTAEYRAALKGAEKAQTDHAKTVTESTKTLAAQRQMISLNINEIQKEIVVMKQMEVVDRAAISQKQALIASLRNEKQAIDLKTKSLKAASDTTASATTIMGGFAASLGGVAGALGIATTAAAGFAVAIKGFNQAIEFQRTINTIQAVGQVTDVEMEKASKAIQAYGASSVFTSQEVADAFKEMVKAGFTVSETLSALPGVLNAAAVSQEGLQRSSEVVVGALRAFGLEADKAIHVADVLAQGDAKASTSISELGEALKYVGVVAKGSNQTLEDTVAVLAFLSTKTIKAGDAGTDLSAVLVRLQNPPAEAAAAIRKLGVDIEDAKTKKIRPFIDIIIDMQKELKRFSAAGQTKILSDISGLNNLKSLQTLAQASAKELRDMQAAIHDVDGVSQSMADTILKGPVGAINRLSGAFDAFMLAIGQGLANGLFPLIEAMGGFFGSLNTTQPVVESFTSAIVSLFASMGNLLGILDLFFQGFSDGVPFVEVLERTLAGLSVTVDTLATSLQNATTLMLGFVEAGGGGGFSALKNRLDQVNANKAASEGRTGKIDQYFNERAAGFGSYTRIEDLVAPSAKPARIPSAGGGLDYNTGKTKKGPKGKSAASLERMAVSDVKDNIAARIKDVSLAARGAAADLGPYASELDKLQLKQSSAAVEAAVYVESLEKLRKLSGKTVEGQKERNKAIGETTRALKENGIESKETANQIRKLADDQTKAAQAYARQVKLINSENSTQSAKNRIQFELDDLEEALAQQQITAQQYYDERLALIERNFNVEKTALETQIDLLNQELNSLDRIEANMQRRRQLELELLKLKGQGISLEQSRQSTREDLNRKERASAKNVSNQLKQSTQQGLSEAISDVLKGGKVGDAIKKFATSFRDAIINALSNALAERLVKGFQGLFDKFGSFANQIAGNGVQTQANPLRFLSGSLLGNAGGSTIGSQSGIGSGSISNTLSSFFNARGVGQFAPSLGGGAATVGSSTGGIGALLGKAGGFLSAAGGPLAIAAASAANASKEKGLLNKYISFIDPLGFRKLFGLGGNSAKKAQQKQEKFDRFDAGLGKIQGSTDTNNLDSIYNALLSVTRLFKKNGGSRNLGVANQYIAELKKAQEQRKLTIAEFIKDSNQQNLSVQAEIDKIGKSSAEQLFLSNKVALSGLAVERDKALEAYKDSEEAKTKILENYTLQRELIAKQEVEQYKENVTNLGDLLQQRDEIVNSNFFKRRQTLEQKKASDLSSIDAEIARNLKDLQAFQANGTAIPSDLKAGLASLLARANSSGITPVQLDVVINESTDAAATQRMIENAFEGFLRSLGANAA